eukprot:11222417-Lingulodinium_polyedra.AAC.1
MVTRTDGNPKRRAGRQSCGSRAGETRASRSRKGQAMADCSRAERDGLKPALRPTMAWRPRWANAGLN